MEYLQHGTVAEIHVDDGKVNAMGPAFFDELNVMLDRAEREKPSALVVSGREGYFSPGLNVKVLPTLPDAERDRTLRSFGHTLLRVWMLPVPTVAAVTGHAVAGGLFLAFACDKRVLGGGGVRLQANEHAIGLPLPSWALAITASVLGGATYVDVMLHARPYGPDEAVALGLVDEVVDPSAVRTRAREVAATMSGLSQPAYALSKARMRAREHTWARDLVDAEMTGFPVRG